MNRELKRLSERRAQLVADCAQQREDLGAQLAALRAPARLGALGGLLTNLGPLASLLLRLAPVTEWLTRRGKLRLALAGIALSLATTRPRRLLSLATGAISLWRTVL